MSVVTTVVIVHNDRPTLGGSLKEKLAKVNLCTLGGLEFKELDHCKDVGGYKCAEVDIWTGAFNHFDHEGFLAFLGSHPWRYPDEVAVTVHCEDFTYAWTVAGGVAPSHEQRQAYYDEIGNQA